VADYSVGGLVDAARAHGFSGAALVTAVAVSLAENTGRTLRAVNTNADGSRDRGPWQINDRAHPDVSDACAFSLDCAAGAAFTISSQGRSWQPWTTWTSGAYRQFLQEAQAATAGSTASQAASSAPDPLGLGSAVQSATRQVIGGAQVAGGALLILAGLLVAFLLMRRG
jgi:Lysozyme like domain